MDFLLKTLTPLNVIAAFFLCILTALAIKHASYPLGLYQQWRYPPQNSRSFQEGEIMVKAEQREKRRVENHYERIEALLKRSEAEGFEIEILRSRAREALALNAPGRREEATRRLHELEMDIPRKKVQYIPMGGREQ